MSGVDSIPGQNDESNIVDEIIAVCVDVSGSMNSPFESDRTRLQVRTYDYYQILLVLINTCVHMHHKCVGCQANVLRISGSNRALQTSPKLYQTC